jgi:hypothetical protein
VTVDSALATLDDRQGSRDGEGEQRLLARDHGLSFRWYQLNLGYGQSGSEQAKDHQGEHLHRT